MKLNNKGFAISTVMYMILIMAVILITLTLTLLSSRKLILDKTKQEARENIYGVYDISYRQALEILKSEAIVYAEENNVEKESIKIDNLNSSIEKEILDDYELSEKYLTVVTNDGSYNVYLGNTFVVSANESITDMLDIVGYSITGNSVQDGVPAPATPVQIESVGELVTNSDDENYGKYKIPVKISSKNLISLKDIYSINTSGNIYSEQVEDGRNTIRFIDAYNAQYTNFEFKENTQYTIQFEAKTTIRNSANESGSLPMRIFYTDGTYSHIFIPRDTDWKKYTLTTTAGKTVESLGLVSYNYVNWVYIDIDTFQIEEGSVATEYEPYEEPITTNIYLDEPLRKVGDYSDYLDYLSGKIVRNIDEVIYNGTEGWELGNFTTGKIWYRLWNTNFVVSPPILCSHELNIDDYYSMVEEDVNGIRINPTTTYLFISDNKLPQELDSFKTWLNDNNMTVLFPIKTPIEQTVELPMLTSLNGTTKLSVDTSIQPSNVEFTIIKKIKQL